MHERVAIVNQELQAYVWPDYVHCLNSDKLNVAETLATIEGLQAISR
jgi:hypothetical protein